MKQKIYWTVDELAEEEGEAGFHCSSWRGPARQTSYTGFLAPLEGKSLLLKEEYESFGSMRRRVAIGTIEYLEQ